MIGRRRKLVLFILVAVAGLLPPAAFVLISWLQTVREMNTQLERYASTTLDRTDEVFGNPVRWGLGYGIGHPGAFDDPNPTTFGVSGAGGGTAYADTKTGLAFALTKNVLSADFGTATTISDLVRRRLAI